MRLDAFEAVVKLLSRAAPNADATVFVTELAESGFVIAPRQKKKPKPKRPKLKVIRGGLE